MKNEKLKMALKKMPKNNSKDFETLGIEEISTVKGGNADPVCGSNCPNVNCGWN